MSEFVSNLNTRKWGEAVLGSEVPLLVDFGDDWYGPCHAVNPILEEIRSPKRGPTG
jgi:thioredoxin 1